jgi:glycosyltransferase involved in cell wall biosynthesis
VFASARSALGERVVAWGFQESRDAYVALLASCDVALSTARHEFQGLAVLESAACGAVPLVPDSLVYREIWPAEYRYAPGRLPAALRRRIEETASWRGGDPLRYALPFDWTALQPRWEDIFRLAF